MKSLTSRKPYLVRAINQWILDNGLTPFISVNADIGGVVVPLDHIDDGEIILNMNPQSIRNLEIGDEYILFDARFSGQSFSIVVPVTAVQAIYAKENGEGMLFVADTEIKGSEEHDPDDSPSSPITPNGRPSLKIVK